jgi:hypothetical protein
MHDNRVPHFMSDVCISCVEKEATFIKQYLQLMIIQLLTKQIQCYVKTD